MDIFKPEEETLELLAAELGFIVEDKPTQPRPYLENHEDGRKFRQPAIQKPFSQLT